MVKKNRAVETKSDKKNQLKGTPTVVTEPASDQVDLSKLPGGPIGATGVQAARLSDPRLLDAQRQAIAAQIGRVQGNRHLRRVIASLKQDEKGVFDRSRNRVEQEIPVDKTVQRAAAEVGENWESGVANKSISMTRCGRTI